MSKAKSGGGITMNKNVSVNLKPGGRKIDVVSPGAVSRIGPKVAEGTTHKPLVTRQATEARPLGNAVAANSRMGPGADRTIHRTGSQGHHGQSNEPKKG